MKLDELLRWDRIASGSKDQPAPERILRQDLQRLDRVDERSWFHLRSGQIKPSAVVEFADGSVGWSSIWASFPDVYIRFIFPVDYILAWEIWSPHSGVPDAADVSDLKSDVDWLINSRLRKSYGN